MTARARPGVVRLDATSGDEEPLPLDPSRLAPGSPMPQQFVRNGYTDATGRFHGGLWRSSVGSWRVSYTENELCVLVTGRIRVTGDDGGNWEFGPGDAFVMPAGFEGLWEVLEPASKVYAIYEAPAA
jgi:uncharacterized protein